MADVQKGDCKEKEEPKSEGFQLKDSQLKAYRECFDVLDADKDGKLGSQDVVTALRAVGVNLTMSEVNDIISEIDTNGDGFINWEEFKAMIQRSWKSTNQNALELIASFSLFDGDKDGYITADELRNALVSFGEKMSLVEAEYYIKMADTNGDKKIDYTEYSKIICGEK